MNHTLVTILGRSRESRDTGYRKTTYRFPDGTRDETAFFGLALARHIRCRVRREKGDGREVRAGARGGSASPAKRVGMADAHGNPQRARTRRSARERVKESDGFTNTRHSRERACEEIGRLSQITAGPPKIRRRESQQPTDNTSSFPRKRESSLSFPQEKHRKVLCASPLDSRFRACEENGRPSQITAGTPKSRRRERQ